MEKVKESEVVLVINQEQTEQQTAIQLKEQFEPFELQAREWMDKAQSLVVTDESQTAEMKLAKEARLALKQIRISVDKKHKELKEDALRKGQLLDKIKRTLNGMIEPIEEHLERQEKYVEIKEKEERVRLQSERIELLLPYMGEIVRSMPLGEMEKEAFDSLLEGQKLAFEKKKEDEAKAERERLAEIERKKKEDERIRKENERLKKEHEKQEAKLKAEREERLRLENEAREREELLEQERKAKLAEERKLKRAPDKTKLIDFAERLSNVELPDLKDSEAKRILENAAIEIGKIANRIKSQAENI